MTFEERVIKEFMETLCPCQWIITTPEHKKKDCPYYTFSAEQDLILSSVREGREEVVSGAVVVIGRSLVCIGPKDEPHRCSFAHCGNCGYCDTFSGVFGDLLRYFETL